MKKIIINKDDAGKRIDKFLAMEFFSMSRSEIAKNIKNSKALVNSGETKPSYILKENDIIEIDFAIEKEELVANPKIKLDIIFENPNFIVLNKPAGIQVHPSPNEKENTLANGLIVRYPEIANVHDDSTGAEFRPGIVHRLDKETSGLMLVVKNMETFEELKKMFQERKISKKYLAIIYGKIKGKKGEIRKPIARSTKYDKQVIAGSKTKTKIRPAITAYKVIREFGNCSLLEVFPKTGRMHQIRVHLASVGTPVVGDKIYWPKFLKRKFIPCARHLLHAEQLKFELFGEKFSFQAKMPDDFNKFISGLTEKA